MTSTDTNDVKLSPYARAMRNRKSADELGTQALNSLLNELLETARKENEEAVQAKKEPVEALLARLKLERTPEPQSAPRKLKDTTRPEPAERLNSSSLQKLESSHQMPSSNPRSQSGILTSEPIERQLSRAREEGYKNGWDAGKSIGYKLGKEEGKKAGRMEGLVEGRRRGKQEGFQQGLERGKEIYYKQGLEVGKIHMADMQATKK